MFSSAAHGCPGAAGGGSTIADVDENFDRIVAPYLPKAIFFYAGENDLSSGKPAAQSRLYALLKGALPATKR